MDKFSAEYLYQKYLDLDSQSGEEIQPEQRLQLRQGFYGAIGEEWAANHQDCDIYLLDPADQPKRLYDRSKFSLALERMDHDHDCNNGITWDTIDYYLDEYCLP